MNNINRSAFHFIKDVADILADEPGDKQLDAGEGTYEDDDGGIAGDRRLHDPHDQGVYYEQQADDTEGNARNNTQLKWDFGEGGDGREGEFEQFREGVFAFVVEKNGESLYSKNVFVKQPGSEKSGTSADYSNDGKVVTLQSHTQGAGIPIVILGDGFLDTSLVDSFKNNPDLYITTNPENELDELLLGDFYFY